jgi:hypothetical protein
LLATELYLESAQQLVSGLLLLWALYPEWAQQLA